MLDCLIPSIATVMESDSACCLLLAFLYEHKSPLKPFYSRRGLPSWSLTPRAVFYLRFCLNMILNVGSCVGAVLVQRQKLSIATRGATISETDSACCLLLSRFCMDINILLNASPVYSRRGLHCRSLTPRAVFYFRAPARVAFRLGQA